MGLRGGQEREVVSAVGDGGTEQCQAVPEGRRGQVGAQDNGPHYRWQHVRDLWQREVTNTVCLLSHMHKASSNVNTDSCHFPKFLKH